MKPRILLSLCLFVFASVCRAQDNQPAKYDAGWFLSTNSSIVPDGAASTNSPGSNPQVPGGTGAVAEMGSYDITELARNLRNDPKRMFDFVHDHIRYVHYFGSHKGAEMTLLDRSGNDFDQCALLMALFETAGLTATYQFGMVSFPYSATNHLDFQHWVGATMPNTNWTATKVLVSSINGQGGFPTNTTLPSDTNDVVFHHVWLVLTLNGTNYTLDPSFKDSEPVTGVANLDAAMGLNVSNLLSAAGGTHNASYVQGLSESAVRNALQGYTTNLLSYLQSNCPNASVQQVIGGQQIVSSVPYALGQVPLAFTVQQNNGYWPVSTWTYIPTSLMAVLTVGLPGLEGPLPPPDISSGDTFYTPFLSGTPLFLTFNTSGDAILWFGQYGWTAGIFGSTNSTQNVTLGIQHPYGSGWDFTSTNPLVRNNFADQSVTRAFQNTNGIYSILYGFDVNPAWLTEQQQLLDAYRAYGFSDTSEMVKAQTLNVMGLSWLAQTEMAEELMAGQEGVIHHFHHRLGRMALEPGKGYYVDVYAQVSGNSTGTGTNSASVQARNQIFQGSSYFASAMEHGVIEQLQNSNLVAASTVKMLEIACTNSQTIYLATSTNWSSGANVSGNISNYNNSDLYNTYIASNYSLLLPRSGSIQVAGTGTWSGSGYVALQGQGGQSQTMGMIISGGYHGGYVSDPNAIPNTSTTVSFNWSQPTYFNLQTAFNPIQTTSADPVDVANGTFQTETTDLTLGQTEPRGLSFTRYYNSSRHFSSPAGISDGWLHNYYCAVNQVAAPMPALGTTTPQQMAPMIVATRAMLNEYNSSTPDPQNWLVAALIAKWEIDQLTKNGASVTLGNSTIQFIQQPDGTFTPPANCTMTLTGSSGAYSLHERNGRTFNFGTNNSLSSIVDPYSQSMHLTYNSNNLLTNVADSKGRHLTLSYTSNQLSSVADSTGRSVSFSYNSQGDLASVTDPESKTSTFQYNSDHTMLAVSNANSQMVVANSYDENGRVQVQDTMGNTNQQWLVYWSQWETSVVDPMGGEQDYFFDDKSRQIASQDALGNLTQTLYDGQDHVTNTISPLNETNLLFYDGSNNLIRTVDPSGLTNTYVYDSNNNLTETIDPLGHSNLFGYNSQFSLTTSTNGAGNGFALTYNTNGTLYTRQDPGGTSTFTYDSYGQVNSITYPGSLGSEGFLNSTAGDVLSHTNARSFVTTFQYNQRRQLTNVVAPTNITTSLSYDAVGNLVTSKDARGFTTTNFWSATRHQTGSVFPSTPQGVPAVTNLYDTRDWLMKTANPLQQPTYIGNNAGQQLVYLADSLSRTNMITYDPDGHPTNSTDAAMNKTSQKWDARGHLVKITDAATNVVGKAYDSANNLIFLTNRNGKHWQFQYDAANRLTNTISPLTYKTSQTYNTLGLLQSVTDPLNQSTTFFYDALRRMTNKTDSLGTNIYQYDANNNLTLLTNAGRGIKLSWGFDAYDHPTAFTNAAGYVIQYRYDNNGNLTNLIYPGSGSRTVKYAYDSLSRLTNVTDWTGRQTTLAYDLAGHLTGVTRPNNTSRTIGYDNCGELTNIVEQAASGFPVAFYTLHYNSAGRADWEFRGPPPHPYTPPGRTITFDDDNRLSSFNGTSVTVDNDGNMTYGPGTNNAFGTYSYDARNELTSAGGLSYGYDPAGSRTSVTNGTNVTVFVIDPKTSQLLLRIKGGVTNYYVYGLGLLYESDETATTTNAAFYHFDSRGSTVALTDTNGNPTDAVEYSAYGTTTYRVGTNDTPFLYNGRYGVQTDPNGLLFMRARYYNPYICRFLNPDPSGFSGGLNFYAFADGNPISLVDPFGLGADQPWYNRAASWVNNQVSCIQSAIDNNLPWQLAGIIDTPVSILGGVANTPQALGNFGTGAGTFSANPTLANAAGLARDISLAAGAGAGLGSLGTAAGATAAAAENAPLANILEGHSAGQGFTGVYDTSTGNVLIAPSTAEAAIPAGWVARAGGHADVSAALGGDAANHSGFAVVLQQDGTLNITWRSGTLNPAPNYVVPPNLRPTIINSVQSATGRTINP